VAAHKTIIVTDSSADLSREEIEANEITIVALHIHVDGEVVDDCPDLRCKSFHERMSTAKSKPRVSAPTVAEFIEVYRELAQGNVEIVSIHMSSELGQTYQNAVKAKASLAGRHQITVIDSRMISTALGDLVIEAAKASQKGHSAAQITQLVRGLIPHTYFAFYVNDYEQPLYSEFMPAKYRSVSDASGNRPVMLIEEGEVVPLQLQRNRGDQYERLADFVSEFGSLKRIDVLSSGTYPLPSEFTEQLASHFPRNIIREEVYGPVMGCLAGSEALCIVARDK